VRGTKIRAVKIAALAGAIGLVAAGATLMLPQVRNRAAPAPGHAGARISFDHDAFNAGEAKGPSPMIVKHRFEFQNIGDADVVISGSRSSCGCAVAALPKTPVEPGDRSYIDVELTLGEMGTRASDVFVLSNAASSPHRLVISATFVPERAFVLEPAQLDWSAFPGEPITCTLTVHAFSLSPAAVKVKEIRSRSHYVTATLISSTVSAQKTMLGYYRSELKLSVQPLVDTLGDYEDKLSIELLTSSDDTLEVPVRLSIVPKVQCSPRRILLVFTSGDVVDSVQRTVQLKHADHVRLDCVEIRNPFHAWLDVAAQPGEGSFVFRPTKLPPSVRISGNVELVLVGTTDKQKHIVSIPVSARVIQSP